MAVERAREIVRISKGEFCPATLVLPDPTSALEVPLHPSSPPNTISSLIWVSEGGIRETHFLYFLSAL